MCLEFRALANDATDKQRPDLAAGLCVHCVRSGPWRRCPPTRPCARAFTRRRRSTSGGRFSCREARGLPRGHGPRENPRYVPREGRCRSLRHFGAMLPTTRPPVTRRPRRIVRNDGRSQCGVSTLQDRDQRLRVDVAARHDAGDPAGTGLTAQAAATAVAAAPSAITRLRSITSRTAAAACARSTTTAPSTSFNASSSISGATSE